MAAAFGTEVLYTREGGSGPEADLQDVLGAPVVFLGVSLPDDGWHAPNEKVEIPLLLKGAEAAAHLWDELAAVAAAGDQRAARTWRWRAPSSTATPAPQRRRGSRPPGRDPAHPGAAARATAGPRSSATPPALDLDGRPGRAGGPAVFLGTFDGRRLLRGARGGPGHRRRARAPLPRAARGRRRCSAPATPAWWCTPSRWPTGTPPTRTARAAARAPCRERRAHPPLPGRRQRALPAHRPGGDHARPRRRRPAAARPAGRLAGGPVLDPGRVRRAGGVARGSGAPRGARGGRHRRRRR